MLDFYYEFFLGDNRICRDSDEDDSEVDEFNESVE